MQLVTLPRAGGKTRYLAEWVAADSRNRVVVVAYLATRRYLMDILIIEHGYAPSYAERMVLSATSSRSLRGRNVLVAVDDIDLVLGVLLGASVTLATFSEET
jgi:hypothetical protein